MILFFPLSVLKRRSTWLQSKIIKADNGNPGFFGNWFFLWKFDGVDSRWNVFCVNRWHSNRYYTINQGTEQRKDTKLKLSTQTAGILVSLGSLEFTTNDFPEGKLRCACANPELPLTRMGRPADNASRAVNPKPSVLEGIMARSTSQNNCFNLSLLCTNALTITWSLLVFGQNKTRNNV